MANRCRNSIAACLVYGCFWLASVPSNATQPPVNKQWPSAEYADLLVDISQRSERQSAGFRRRRPPQDSGIALVGTAIIPVLPVKFSNSSIHADKPIVLAEMQQQLFGTWSTGSLTDYYKENSNGNFVVTGKVFGWAQLPDTRNRYQDGCETVKSCAPFAGFLDDVFKLHDVAVDFALHDNDGVDGIPNSGDDDGFVDVVFILQPRSGGECPGAADSFWWSHQGLVSALTGSDFVTNDPGKNGPMIKIDSYFIGPSLACDDASMSPIGIFAHEFGHALGLPDLYDTDYETGASNGIGTWGVMGYGGQDKKISNSTAFPAHLSAWSKERLGWANINEVSADTTTDLSTVNIHGDILRVPDKSGGGGYYLLENRDRPLTGFDSQIPGSGVLIWRINPPVVNVGMINNSVNADETDKGVGVVEADGKTDLDMEMNLGDDGDVFPGSAIQRKFDDASSPKNNGGTAVCDIADASHAVHISVFTSRSNCSAH